MKLKRWRKNYHNDKTTIVVDFEKQSINYDNKIQLGDKRTSNFKSSEKFCCFKMC